MHKSALYMHKSANLISPAPWPAVSVAGRLDELDCPPGFAARGPGRLILVCNMIATAQVACCCVGFELKSILKITLCWCPELDLAAAAGAFAVGRPGAAALAARVEVCRGLGSGALDGPAGC